jgi:ferric-dicitrate binding protein FerR (iron transport regulator)
VQIPTIVTENKEVQLILSSGEKSKFDEDIQIKYNSVGNIVVESKSGEMLETHEIEIEPAQLNKLIVPRGKRSSMLLADGSRIWVNSGTTVEFPSTFSQKERRISVDGEIYIEVANDPQKPFHVSTKDFDVVVLGTTFNVTAYSKDELQHITVAEGLVSVFTKDAEEGSLISRNQQLRVINGQGVEISNVDVYNYTSWHEGILRFESEPLPQILTRLSRYYDINMLFSDDVQSIRCSGKLYLFDEWQVVLDNITIVTPVKYSIQDNNIEFYHSK